MTEKLAVDGGKPVRSKPMPQRGLIGKEEKAAAMRLFDTAIRTGKAFGYNGEPEKRYERDFVRFMGGGFADGVNSGTNAVFCALGALQLDALSEVVVPPVTDPGGIMPVLFAGCVPVVADCDPRSYNTSAEQIEAALTPRTRAVIVAHIAGEPADMDPILTLARARKLYVIEDVAQSHGARYKGRLVGTMGHIAAFSTMFGKHHCTGGQGGVVYTRDEELHWRGKRFADRGKPFHLDAPGNVVAGLNCNLNDLSAAIGSVQLRKLPRIIRARRKIGETIKRELERRGGAVRIGWQVPKTECVYWFLRFRIEPGALRVDSAGFCRALNAEGIPCEVYAHLPGERPWLRNRAVFGKSGFPWTCSDYRGPRRPQVYAANVKKVMASHFMVYMHESFGRQEIRDILDAIEKVEKAYRR